MTAAGQHPVATGLKPSFAGMLARPHQAIALVLGVGLARMWPGTLGTLAGFGLFLLLGTLPPVLRAGVYVLLLIVGTWAVRRTGEDLGNGDHNSIVFDETISMSLALEFVPADVLNWFAAFLLFRLFDVWKPWPVFLAHRTGSGGFPVILDDLLAAVYAVLVVRIVGLTFG